MFSASHRRRAAILLAGMSALVLGIPSLDAQGLPAGDVRLTGGFGADAAGAAEPFVLTQHIIPPVTGPLARTWSKLQKPVRMAFPNETPFEDVLKYLKTATKDKGDSGLSFYVEPVGLQEAEKTMTSTSSMDLDGISLATTLDLLLDQLGLMFYVRGDGLVVITSQSHEGATVDPADQILEELASLRKEFASLSRDLIPQRKPKGTQKATPTEVPAKKAVFRRVAQPVAPQGGATTVPELRAKPFEIVELVSELTSEAADTWLRLQKPVAIPFQQETPLQDVLAYVKKSTKTDGTRDLQIYVDPAALREVEKTLTSPISPLEIDGIPLSSSLSLMLSQLGLKFYVHDEGMVVITNEESDDEDNDGGDPSAKILNQISMLRNEVAILREFSEALGMTRRGR